MVFYLVVLPPTALFLGNAIVESRQRGSPLPSPEVLLVGYPILLVVAFLFGLLNSGSTVLLLIPKSIRIGNDRIVGDFRRRGWKGRPDREILFSNIRDFGKDPLTRVDRVRARYAPTPDAPLRNSTCFYLSESNVRRVKEALASYNRAGRD
jgi:hypothetical protein